MVVCTLSEGRPHGDGLCRVLLRLLPTSRSASHQMIRMSTVTDDQPTCTTVSLYSRLSGFALNLPPGIIYYFRVRRASICSACSQAILEGGAWNETRFISFDK